LLEGDVSDLGARLAKANETNAVLVQQLEALLASED
jgi:hypothetical protein